MKGFVLVLVLTLWAGAAWACRASVRCTYHDVDAYLESIEVSPTRGELWGVYQHYQHDAPGNKHRVMAPCS